MAGGWTTSTGKPGAAVVVLVAGEVVGVPTGGTVVGAGSFTGELLAEDPRDGVDDVDGRDELDRAVAADRLVLPLHAPSRAARPIQPNATKEPLHWNLFQATPAGTRAGQAAS
jgi:hypothetical protein